MYASLNCMGSIPGSGRPPGKGNGNPHQYSCLKNPMERVWQATDHGVDTTWQLRMHTIIYEAGK